MKKQIQILLLLLVASISQLKANNTFENPILRGFYPDPSICRVGDDYFMVTSSFEWYPGIPIHHSKDLVNWQQIGHVLNRPTQLTIKQGMRASAGVWAPTIRYINGKYYVIVTAKQCGNTFYVSATDPFGEWSDPTYLRDAPGIDPSLFCDDDGSVWICANDKYKKEEMLPGQTSNEFIWVQRIDLDKGKLLGERYRLPHGLTLNSPATEAPHIYKVNGKYYLMTAEGMTWNNHAVALFKSDKISGPYVACNNGKPVLTHRHLPNAGGDITTTGHADIVQTQNGEWWAVLLAVRPVEGMNLLGRESFLCPVKWENEELIFAPENDNRVELRMKRPNLPLHEFEKVPARDEFDTDELRLEWNFLRTPLEKFHTLKSGALALQLKPQIVDSLVTPAFIARRVQDHKFNTMTQMNFTPEKSNEEAGLVIMQNSTNFYKFTLVKDELGKLRVRLVKSDRRKLNIYETSLSNPLDNIKDLILGIEGDGLEYRFYYALKGNSAKRIYVGEVQDASVCASNRAGGFTGSYVGMYASSNGELSENSAAFDWFEYKNQ